MVINITFEGNLLVGTLLVGNRYGNREDERRRLEEE